MYYRIKQITAISKKKPHLLLLDSLRTSDIPETSGEKSLRYHVQSEHLYIIIIRNFCINFMSKSNMPSVLRLTISSSPRRPSANSSLREPLLGILSLWQDHFSVKS